MEEAPSGFHVQLGTAAGFRFTPDPRQRVQWVVLEGMGPKLLLSDATTADAAVLRWRLRVVGNNALEFGVVPADSTVRRCCCCHSSPQLYMCVHMCAGAAVELALRVFLVRVRVCWRLRMLGKGYRHRMLA